MAAATDRRARTALVVAAAVLGAAAVVVGLVRSSGRLPEGPVAVPWDHATCAECGMLVGEPGFAAQLHTLDGDVLFFDDPGCLLRYEEAGELRVYARWFHHVHEDRWVNGDRVAFLSVEPTPMGYGLGAVASDRAEAVSLEEARRRVGARGEMDSAR